MNFYKHYIGDFQRDTGHLSLIERGAYRSLLDHHYATERPLPTDSTQLCRLVGAITKEERDAVAAVLEQFWQLTDGGWINARAQKEIAKADEQRETNRRVTEQRVARRKAVDPVTVDDTNRATNRSTNRSTIRSTNDQPIQTPDSRLQTISLNPSESSCVISSLEVAKIARAEGEQRQQFETIKALYPPHAGRTDWISAEHHIRRHIEQGATWEQIRAGVERYAAHVVATNRMVLNPARFFGDADRPWSQAWPIPPSKAQVKQSSNIAAAQAWLEGTNAAG